MIPIYEPTTPKPTEYALRLVKNDSGDPKLIIVDKATGVEIPEGNVVKIEPGGKLYRYGGINPYAAEALGIELDSSGRIVSSN